MSSRALDRLAPGRGGIRHQRRRPRGRFPPGHPSSGPTAAVTPLADAGLTKEQIRAQAQAWGLTVWDKPPGGVSFQPDRPGGIQISPARLAGRTRRSPCVNR